LFHFIRLVANDSRIYDNFPQYSFFKVAQVGPPRSTSGDDAGNKSLSRREFDGILLKLGPKCFELRSKGFDKGDIIGDHEILTVHRMRLSRPVEAAIDQHL